MKKLLCLAGLLCGWGWAEGQQHLVMVGGGAHPKEAMKAFYDWTGRPSPHILVIGWASSVPDENLQIVSQDYAQYAERPQLELAGREREQVLQQLEHADGVWFTGGDQVKVMAVLQDPVLLAALRSKYAGGTVFGGTSAGTAIMSLRMLTGNADLTVIDGTKVEMAPGLGLLPEHVIVDQHFLRRQRENRLLGALSAQPGATGMGIDEDTAVLLSGGVEARVVGRAQVMLLEPQGSNGWRLRLFQPGDRFRLDS